MHRLLLALALLLPGLGAGAQDAPKTLRYAFRVAETGFDPAKIQDLYSRVVTPHIFEALVGYDHLARPAKLKPLTTTELPVPSEDFKVWTARVRPGIHFQDDPAFKGQKRELTAADFAYAWKRFADPKNASPAWSTMESWKIVGLKAARERAQAGKRAFDYDAPLRGLQVLDRYTLRIELEETLPHFLQEIALSDLFGAVAREVVEAYGEDLSAHPVGTGPFVLRQWRRGSLIVLERNPGYRERFYDAEPSADDAEGLALAARFKGRRIPMLDRVEISILTEDQPRWLSFLGGEQDFIERVPEAFTQIAAPGGRLAPNLAKRGMRLHRTLGSDVFLLFFNFEDPVVGGLAPEQVALRRAIGLAMDVPREIRIVRRSAAIQAQGNYPPHTSAYRAGLTSAMGEFNPAKAKALLDTYGLPRRRRRRLPRGARRRAAASDHVHHPRGQPARDRRAVRQGHEAHRPVHPLQGRQVARAVEGGARRQAADVDGGLLLGADRRQLGRLAPGQQPRRWQQHRPLQAPRGRRAV
jgi:ABC-type transport system substrate-binding protein